MKIFFSSPIKLTLILSFSLLNTSCASYALKQECAGSNWFTYGEKLALSGQRPEEDSLVQKCRKAEAKVDESLLDKGFKKGQESYCKPEYTFKLGKSGEPFQESMCQGLNLTRLKASHAKGIKEFCRVENAYPFGASGKLYQNACSAEVEKAYLKEYHRGRKTYLSALISEKELSLERSKKEEQSLEGKRSALEGELRGLNFAFSATNSANPELIKRKESVESQIRSLDLQVREQQNSRKRSQAEISKLKVELATLGDK